MQPAIFVSELPGQFAHRHNAAADFIADQDDIRFKPAENSEKPVFLLIPAALFQAVAEPQGKAVDDDKTVMASDSFESVRAPGGSDISGLEEMGVLALVGNQATASWPFPVGG